MEYTSKDDDKAREFCFLANDTFSERNCFEALIYLNKSLCFAVSPEVSAIGYSIRAMIYLHLKLYDHCLHNINLSRKSSKIEHEEFTKQLNLAEERCQEDHSAERKINDSNATLISNFLKLSYPANPKLPFAAECLELKENEKFGRHIVTNRNLKAGDIIAITPNIYNFIDKEARFHHCSSCLKSNDMNLFPCPGCPNGKMTAINFMLFFQFLVLLVMFCSPRCMHNEMRERHPDVCGLISPLLPKSEIMRRMVNRSTITFQSSPSVEEFNRIKDPKICNIFEFDFSECETPTFCKNMMLSAMSGQRSWPKPKTTEINSFSSFYSPFSELYEHLEPTRILSSKMINEGTNSKNFLIANNIGLSFHPLENMFNTNCHPNLQVARFNEKGVSAWIVKYPVKAGDQLFKSYRQELHWHQKYKDERQKIWKEIYGFKCECEACVNDWKLYKTLDFKKLKTKLVIQPKDAIKKFKENCMYIGKNYENKYQSGERITIVTELILIFFPFETFS